MTVQIYVIISVKQKLMFLITAKYVAKTYGDNYHIFDNNNILSYQSYH